MQLDTVLVPLPMEGASTRTLHGLANFCRSFDTEVRLLHVRDMPSWFSPQFVGRDEYARTVENAWRKTVEVTTEKLGRYGVTVRGDDLIDGNPRQVIIEHAATAASDVIAIPRRNRGKVLLGRTAKRVLRVSTVPVLSLPALESGGWAPPSPPEGWKRVLVPTDLSEIADKATATALELTERCGGKATVAYVAEDVAPLAVALDQMPVQDPKVLEAFIDEVSKQLVRQYPGADSKVLRGRAADAVVAEANESNADVVVLAAQGKGAVTRLLLGSTTERLVRLSDVPVLVLRES